jgi:predicted acyl esterase
MTTTTTRRRSLWIIAAFALATAVLVAAAPPASAAPPFKVTPGVEHVLVSEAAPGTELTLSQKVGPTETKLVTLRADIFGQADFAYLPPLNANGTPQTLDSWAPGNPSLAGGGTVPGPGRILPPGDNYVIRDNTKTPPPSSDPFTVKARTSPSTADLGQPLNAGYNYLTMRDGVKLSATVRFPDATVFGPAPYPTVVEYSGYDPSNPEAPTINATVALLLGFAVVGVNVRGSGCSGGALDLFTGAQQADGYDVIEIAARQPWARKRPNGAGAVGMIGLSYPGIMQLYVAATNPPSLAAITPMSVTGDLWGGMWPGGVLNRGFSVTWLDQQKATNAAFGSQWVRNRSDAGDGICSLNQLMRAQSQDLTLVAGKLSTRPSALDARDLNAIVPNINVPVYLSGAWQDEQTGSAFADMLGRFKAEIPKRFVLYNGHHPDGYAPANTSRWYEFLQLYVANQVPSVPAKVREQVPGVSGLVYGTPGDVNLDPDRFGVFPARCFPASPPTPQDCLDTARFLFQSEDKVEIRWEMGAARDDAPGAAIPRRRTTLPAWPPSNTTVGTWYLGAGGRLNTAAPVTPASALPGATATGGVDSYSYDPAVGPTAYGSGVADLLWTRPTPGLPMNWTSTAPGKGLSYLTDPLTQDTTIAGSGHVDLWFSSQGTDAEIEVVLSEVTGGNETRIQSGVVRAGFHTVDPARSTATHIELKYGAADLQPLPAGGWTRVKVPIPPVAHVLRAGSKLRLQINTPGGDQPKWAFDTHPYATGNPRQAVGRTVAQPSALVLPLLAGGTVGALQPWQLCAMRGQPCRPYTMLSNAGV